MRVGTWLRRPERIRGLIATWGAYLLLMTASTVGLYLSDSKAGGDVVVALGFLGVFGLPALWAIWRVATAGLLVDEGTIVVRGPIRTRRISPASALGFEPGIFGVVGNGTPGPMLKLGDGHSIGIWALGREGLVWSFERYLQEAGPLCDELNRALEQVNGAPSRVPLPMG